MKIAAEMLGVDLGIDVTVYEQEVGPTVVVEIEKHGAPAEVLGVQAETRGVGDVVESAVAIVAVERGGVVGEVGFENVEAAVAVVVGGRGAHAGLGAAVFVEGCARGDGNVLEGAVAIVVIEDAWGGIAGDENVGPAVVVIVESGDAEGVMAVGLVDVRFSGDVFKGSIAAIAVEDIFCAGQALRSAHDRSAFPNAGGPLAWRGRGC